MAHSFVNLTDFLSFKISEIPMVDYKIVSTLYRNPGTLTIVLMTFREIISFVKTKIHVNSRW